jgi:ATP-dependent exoDNAse (exonuclease V) alpha subunit
MLLENTLSENTELIFTDTQTTHNFTFLCHLRIFSSTDKLLDCISDLNTWMAHNFLQKSQDKTVVLNVGAKAQRENLVRHSNSQGIKIEHQVKHIVVILDSELYFKSHIKNVTKIVF